MIPAVQRRQRGKHGTGYFSLMAFSNPTMRTKKKRPRLQQSPRCHPPRRQLRYSQNSADCLNSFKHVSKTQLSVLKWLSERGISFATTSIDSGRFRRSFAFTHTIGGLTADFDLLLPEEYPTCAPRLRLVSKEMYGQIPHLEASGLLCLFDNSTEFNVENVEAVLIEIFNRAEAVIGRPNAADFSAEIQSYWPQYDKEGGFRNLQLLSDIPISAKTAVGFCGKTGACVGIDRPSLCAWVSNWLGQSASSISTIDVPILDLSQPLIPTQFPETIGQLLDLAEKANPDVYNTIVGLLCRSVGNEIVLIRNVIEGQTIYLGVNVMRGLG